MSLSVYLLAILTCTFLCGQASAGGIKLGVEPYLGYGEFSYSTSGVGDSKTGPVLGGKGGLYFTDSAWLALDYHLGGPYNLANNDNEFLNRMWGAGLGIVRKGKVRGWIGYYYSSVIDDIENNVAYEGTGLKLSLGVELKTKLCINIEYSRQDYRKIRAGGETIAPPTSLEVSVVYFSLSAPIQLN